jgi:hypothetical protein
LRSRTSATIVRRSAQSLTSSWSRPQNNLSIPWGLVIWQTFSNKQNYNTVQVSTKQPVSKSLQLNSDLKEKQSFISIKDKIPTALPLQLESEVKH